MPSKKPLLPSNDITSPTAPNKSETIDADHPDRVIFRSGHGVDVVQDSSINSSNSAESNVQNHIDNDDEEPIAAKIVPIHSKTKNWYSSFCNRWASLFGAIIKIVIMMLVNGYYGATCIAVVFLVWFYVGTANPAVKPGLAAEFRLFVWLKGLVFRCFG